MSEATGDGAYVDAGGEELRGDVVAEVVKSHGLETSALERVVGMIVS